jgi:hypothetical protein
MRGGCRGHVLSHLEALLGLAQGLRRGTPSGCVGGVALVLGDEILEDADVVPAWVAARGCRLGAEDRVHHQLVPVQLMMLLLLLLWGSRCV